MTINRNNYEVYIIDYYDGKLTPVESAELLFFLSQNPELEEEFNMFSDNKLVSETQQLNDKVHLYKHFSDIEEINDSNFEELCIAFAEGELDKNTGQKLLYYLDKKPRKKLDFELYQKVRLNPDLSLTYPHRNKLKRNKPVIVSYIRPLIYFSAAAAILIILFLTGIFKKTQPDQLISQKVPAVVINNTEDSFFNKSVPNEKADAQNNMLTKQPLRIKKIIKPEDDTPSHMEKTETKSKINDELLAIHRVEIKYLENSYNPAPLSPTVKAPVITYENNGDFTEEKTLKSLIADKIVTNENFNLWALAEAGIKGINYLTESDVKIARKTNEAGKITGIDIDSETFGISAPLNQ
ncbi:MAG: hypothetical protein JXB00_09600 [Bacteroidales bacterium]|nr:hypothetical protein [Bacteroidales bacterium]